MNQKSDEAVIQLVNETHNGVVSQSDVDIIPAVNKTFMGNIPAFQIMV